MMKQAVIFLLTGKQRFDPFKEMDFLRIIGKLVDQLYFMDTGPIFLNGYKIFFAVMLPEFFLHSCITLYTLGNESATVAVLQQLVFGYLHLHRRGSAGYQCVEEKRLIPTQWVKDPLLEEWISTQLRSCQGFIFFGGQQEKPG
jgi:hypothetical protein